MSAVRKSFAATAAFVALTLVGWAGHPGSANAIEIQRVVSPHGIEAWLVEDHTIPLVSVSFAFIGGSTQDPPDKPGVANLLISLLDEGAGDLDSQAYKARLEELSVSISYNVGVDYVRGSLNTLVETQDDAAELLRLTLTEPRLDTEPLERVREQILTRMERRAFSPNQLASDATARAVFSDHPYARDPDGTPESVAAITVDDLRTFQNKIFARDNLKVAAVGAIDAETLGALLDQAFGTLPIKANRVAIPEAGPFAPARIDIPLNTPQTLIRMVAPGLKRDDPDYISAYVAAYILGAGVSGSRLYDSLREQRGLVYSVSLGLDPFDHGALVSAGTSTSADQADAVVRLLEEEIALFAANGPTEQELADAKAYLIGSYPLRFVRSGQVARQLLGMQLGDLGIDYIDRRNEMIEALTLKDVRDAASHLFSDADWVVVTVGPTVD